MKSASKFAQSALILLVATVIVLAAADSVLAAEPVVIENATLLDNVVTITVTNPNKKQSPVGVKAQYLDEGKLIVAKKFITVAGQSSVNVELILGTITDDINPLSITEGPDPIPHKIVVSAIMWSD